MIAVILLALLVLVPFQASNQVSDAQKKEFLILLQRLPFEGEFYTDEAIEKAGRYLPVYSRLQRDIAKYDILSFCRYQPRLAIKRNIAIMRSIILRKSSTRH